LALQSLRAFFRPIVYLRHAAQDQIDQLSDTTYTAPMKKLVFWGLLLLVVVGSLLPVDFLPPPVFSIWDKLQHAIAFAALCLLGFHAYRSKSLQVILGLLLLGGVIEIAQAATGWRYGEWLDWLADAIGIGAAVGLSVAWPRLRLRLREG
jgi:VanZ family protein